MLASAIAAGLIGLAWLAGLIALWRLAPRLGRIRPGYLIAGCLVSCHSRRFPACRASSPP